MRAPPVCCSSARDPRGPALPLLTLRDGRRCRFSWDLAETLLKSRRATAAPGILARVFSEKPL